MEQDNLTEEQKLIEEEAAKKAEEEQQQRQQQEQAAQEQQQEQQQAQEQQAQEQQAAQEQQVVQEQQVQEQQVAQEQQVVQEDKAPLIEETVPEPTVEYEQAKDDILDHYSNDGFGKNAYGEYFNPNTDEYDSTYDPHNDPLYNEEAKKEAVEKSNADLLQEYIDILAIMGSMLNKAPYPGIENENVFDISYQFDDADVDRFNELKARLGEITKENPSIPDIYSKTYDRINEIRRRMGQILNKEPYPGIEDEYIFDISYQLDDYEVDAFQDLKKELDEIKKEYPSFFTDKTKENTQSTPDASTAPVDDNPQHEANPETGYAVDGFQAPAVVTNTDDNPQHAPNYETGYAVGGFQAPAVVSLQDVLDENEQTQTQAQEQEPEEEQQQEQQPTEEELNELARQQRRKELLTKSLSFAGGFVVGVGLSCVPGVGAIRMGVAATKLTVSGINAWSNKHPDGKIAQARDFVVNASEERFPNITNGIKNINAKLKSTPVNVFINGVSAGYITGNIFEMVTGNTVFEAIKEKTTSTTQVIQQATPAQPAQTTVDTPTEAPVDTPVDTPVQAPVDTVQQPIVDTPVDTTPQIIDTTPIPDVPVFDASAAAEAVKGGATIDLSGIPQGLVSSDATSAVNLIQEAGKDVSFLREVTLNDGTVMWAFNQSNGVGYAWFKAEDVLNELAKTGQDIVQTAGRSL